MSVYKSADEDVKRACLLCCEMRSLCCVVLLSATVKRRDVS